MFKVFNTLFGKKSIVPQKSITDQINEIREKVELLDKKSDLLAKRIQEENVKAKDFLNQKNKIGALSCLKRKKMYEEQLNSLTNQKINLETLVIKLEESSLQKDTVISIANTTQMLKSINEDIKIENVEKVVDDMRDQLDNIKDIGNLLSEPISNDLIDEDELLEEFEEEKLKEDLLSTNTNLPLPSIPNVVNQTTEEDEFEALEKEMLAT